MNQDLVTAFLRHILTAVGAALAAKYSIDGDVVATIVAGLASAGGLGWSMVEKTKRRRKVSK